MLLNSPSTIHSQLSAARGMRYGTGVGGEAASPWTPADIADLLVFHHYTAANCFQDVARTTPAGLGDPVGGVAPLYGTAIDGNQATGGSRPTLQSAGLQFPTGAERLELTAPLALASDFTVYYISTVKASASAPVLGHTTGPGFIGLYTGQPTIIEDTGAEYLQLPAADAGPAVQLVRINRGASLQIRESQNGYDETAASSVGQVLGQITFDTIGKANGSAIGTDDADERLLLLIVIERSIAFGSAEDLLIREWITDNCGASF